MDIPLHILIWYISPTVRIQVINQGTYSEKCFLLKQLLIDQLFNQSNLKLVQINFLLLMRITILIK